MNILKIAAINDQSQQNLKKTFLSPVIPIFIFMNFAAVSNNPLAVGRRKIVFITNNVLKHPYHTLY